MSTEPDVYAIPGENSIIDTINPATGLTTINASTAADVAARCPGAVRMTWAQWRAEAIARQNTPIIWLLTTAEQYDEMMNVLPPACYMADAFLVGEPSDHSFETGAPRFAAYWHCPGVLAGARSRYLVADRPLTIAEFRAALDPRRQALRRF